MDHLPDAAPVIRNLQMQVADAALRIATLEAWLGGTRDELAAMTQERDALRDELAEARVPREDPPGE
jgi:hypothetical protein